MSVSFWNEDLNNAFRNASFRIFLLWYHVATGMNSFLNKTHSDIALLSCQNAINFFSVEATTRFELLRCYWNND